MIAASWVSTHVTKLPALLWCSTRDKPELAHLWDDKWAIITVWGLGFQRGYEDATTRYLNDGAKAIGHYGCKPVLIGKLTLQKLNKMLRRSSWSGFPYWCRRCKLGALMATEPAKRASQVCSWALRDNKSDSAAVWIWSACAISERLIWRRQGRICCRLGRWVIKRLKGSFYGCMRSRSVSQRHAAAYLRRHELIQNAVRSHGWCNTNLPWYDV